MTDISNNYETDTHVSRHTKGNMKTSADLLYFIEAAESTSFKIDLIDYFVKERDEKYQSAQERADKLQEQLDAIKSKKTDFQIAWELCTSKEKPFILAQIKDLIELYDNQEISLSKLTEEINVACYKWHNNKMFDMVGMLLKSTFRIESGEFIDLNSNKYTIDEVIESLLNHTQNG